MTLSDKQQSLINDLNLIADPHERLSVLVGQATSQELPEELKNDGNRVPGCVSRVWLVGTFEDGRCYFRCAADSPMVKGLVALLCDLYSDATPEDVEQTDPELWVKCGFDRLLSPTRMNGIRSVRARIQDLARQMRNSPSHR